jgi:signal transduction histidine kinase
MLEGMDKDWVYCGDRRFTNYSNLAPGTYTFRVKASNCFGLWNETGAALTLVVATPWWATLYFRISVLFYLAILLYAFFMYRLRQKLKLQSVRNRIARDLHDEIGSNLSSISLFNEVAIGNAEATSPVRPLLKKIGEYTQLSQEAMNDIVWMINARNDKFENIIIHMRALAAELFEAKVIILHMNIDDRLNNLKMEMDMRKNFFLVYKESVNNIIKYAECQNVWIDLILDRATVILRIRDDGKGFDPQHEVYGNGLINMQKRAEAMKGKLTLQSEPGKGTTVELTFRRRN